MARIVLAYSGGLDTSVAIDWLRRERGFEVIAFAADLGQGKELEPLKARALKTGAVEAIIVDLRERFVREFILPALKANAIYENGYVLSTALGRPLIASELVRIARERRCEYIAHGCSGKGNDQVRFEAVAASLAPELKVVAPLREWQFRTREEEIEYAERHGIEVPVRRESPYSIDRNLWGISIECGDLEDPWVAPPRDAYLVTTAPEDAPDRPEELEITFEAGVPVALNGTRMEPMAIIERLNEVGGAHGVGRSDLVEDRVVGIKSREIYEAPAATILIAAHRGLEEITLSKQVLRTKELLSQRFAELIYEGLWYTDLREALSAFFEVTQRYVAGDVRVRLYKGTCTVLGRRSPYSLYDRSLATYGEGDRFKHSAAPGFLEIWNMPLRAEASRRRA